MSAPLRPERRPDARRWESAAIARRLDPSRRTTVPEPELASMVNTVT